MHARESKLAKLRSYMQLASQLYIEDCKSSYISEWPDRFATLCYLHHATMYKYLGGFFESASIAAVGQVLARVLPDQRSLSHVVTTTNVLGKIF